jgi:hypothetical protein
VLRRDRQHRGQGHRLDGGPLRERRLRRPVGDELDLRARTWASRS